MEQALCPVQTITCYKGVIFKIWNIPRLSLKQKSLLKLFALVHANSKNNTIKEGNKQHKFKSTNMTMTTTDNHIEQGTHHTTQVGTDYVRGNSCVLIGLDV